MRASLILRRGWPQAALGALLLWASPSPGQGAEPPPGAVEAGSPRPRVGLVLSGGGARGITHVGVLRVLEELRVPVDAIAGTSMGAAVGGLYAAGVPLEEIERVMIETDWNDLFRDETPRQQLDYRRKQDDRSFLVDTKLGLRGGQLVLPSGVIQGQKLNLSLRSMALRTIGIDHFDQLPIPFRAVAADIDSGEEVVLESGDLATAIRASMSVPGLLAPVQIGGRRLVDGGIARNVPVRVARDLGVDVLIVVDISTPLTELEEQASFIGVSTQVLMILTSRNIDESLALLAPDDVLIQPELEGLSSMDFGRAAEVVELGMQSANRHREQLTRLSLPPAEYAALRSRQHAEGRQLPVIDSVRIETDAELDPEVIAARVRTRPGEPLDPDLLRADLARIYGMDIFERVDFRVERGEGEAELVIDAVEKSWGPPYLRFGAFLADDFDGSATYSLGSSITWLPVNRYGAEWRNEVQLGDEIRVFSEFYQPLNRGSQYFFAPSVEFNKQDVDAFEDGEKVAEVEVTAYGASLEFGRLLWNWGEFRTGLIFVRGTASQETGTLEVDSGRFSEGRAFAGLSMDTLDNANFPRTGSFGGANFLVSSEELGGDDDFELLQVNLNKAFSSGANTVLLGAEFGTTLDEEVEIQDQFALGGFLNLSGLEFDQLRGNHFGLARAVGYRELTGEHRGPLGAPVYLGGSLEAGNVWGDRDEIELDDLRLSGSLFLAADTFFGPIYVGFGLAEGGESSGFLFLGGLPF